MLLLLVPLATGCLRVRASITISPDDLVSGEIIAAAKPKTPKDPGPQLDSNLPFSQKVAVSNYNSDGYVGSQAVFSDLTFGEVPQLAHMNRDAAGVNLSLRRNGNLVLLEGRADLTSVTDPEADVELTVAFPGDVTSTNGDRIEPQVVQWKFKPGVVSTMNAASPLHRSQHAVLHLGGRLAGHRIVRGGRRGGAAGLGQPRPLRAVHHTARPDAQATGCAGDQ